MHVGPTWVSGVGTHPTFRIQTSCAVICTTFKLHLASRSNVSGSFIFRADFDMNLEPLLAELNGTSPKLQFMARCKVGVVGIVSLRGIQPYYYLCRSVVGRGGVSNFIIFRVLNWGNQFEANFSKVFEADGTPIRVWGSFRCNFDFEVVHHYVQLSHEISFYYLYNFYIILMLY